MANPYLIHIWWPRKTAAPDGSRSQPKQESVYPVGHSTTSNPLAEQWCDTVNSPQNPYRKKQNQHPPLEQTCSAPSAAPTRFECNHFKRLCKSPCLQKAAYLGPLLGIFPPIRLEVLQPQVPLNHQARPENWYSLLMNLSGRAAVCWEVLAINSEPLRKLPWQLFQRQRSE